jgi:hypothetical protein
MTENTAKVGLRNTTNEIDLHFYFSKTVMAYQATTTIGAVGSNEHTPCSCLKVDASKHLTRGAFGNRINSERSGVF